MLEAECCRSGLDETSGACRSSEEQGNKKDENAQGATTRTGQVEEKGKWPCCANFSHGHSILQIGLLFHNLTVNLRS